jgi:hypothetical protein
MPATGAYFEPAPANCCAISKRGHGLSVQHFLHWPGRNAICAGPTPSHEETSHGRDQQNDGVGGDAALSSTVET